MNKGNGSNPSPRNDAESTPQGLSPSDPQVFLFHHLVFRHEARIDKQRLFVKQGLRKFDVPLSEILFLYSKSTSKQQTLLLELRRGSKKSKTVEWKANANDPGLTSLADALADAHPRIDLRSLDEATALAHMNISSKRLLWPLLLIVLFPAMVAFALLPKIVHGLDFGTEKLSVSSLIKGRAPTSRNLVITGAQARLDESVEVTTTRAFGDKTSRTTRHIIPLVPPNWDKSQPVHIVLETDEMDAATQDQLERLARFPGIMRDVLWEGLGRDDREYLVNQAGLSLSEEVKLLDYRANPRYDLMVFCVGTGMTLITTTLLVVGIWLRTRRD